ncbi:hypothetical protein [Nocardia australiensis]|uniref:hypothetical protein n=1 Tax=Nocardia australiensis TaxID=2887191 RepID=UPI001D13504D|nr:hypothetical protein [Nocardia australiensis]
MIGSTGLPMSPRPALVARHETADSRTSARSAGSVGVRSGRRTITSTGSAQRDQHGPDRPDMHGVDERVIGGMCQVIELISMANRSSDSISGGKILPQQSAG